MKLMKLFSVICLVIVLAAMPMIVLAASPHAQAHAPATLDDLFTTLKNLGGVALLFAALANVGKRFGWVTDGNAPAVSLGMNTFGLLVLVGLQLTGRLDLVPVFDKSAGALADVLSAILALVLQLHVSRKGHDEVLAGLPLIGYSFSGRKATEGSLAKQIFNRFSSEE